MKSCIFLSSALAAIAAATPVVNKRDYAVKEVHFVPPQYTWEGEAPKDHMLRLSVGLKQSRFDELERHLYEVSDPDHHRYGQHLSSDDINELIQPSAEALDLVHEWLAEHGVSYEHIEYTPARDYLTFSLPVGRVEELLETKYSVFRHEDGTALVRTSEWALPHHLHEHIEMIQPTTSFLRGTPQAKLISEIPNAEIDVAEQDYSALVGQSTEKVCHRGHVSPLCLSTLYGTAGYKIQSADKNGIALNDFLGEINNRSDAKLYLQKFRPEAVKAAQEFKQISVHGGTLQQTPETKKQLAAGTGLEGNLDAQTILGITYPLPLTAYSTNGTPPFRPDSLEPTADNEPYLTWINYILKQTNIPQVISNSYEDDEQTVPLSYATAVCRGYAQLGARGVSVLFGSGDGGVEGVQNGGNCTSNRNGQRQFIPLFPSSCPYITSVGATVDFYPEVVAFDPRNGFASGGGFSNYFARPSYQDAAVSAYLSELGNEFSKLYNHTGRAYPDIAAYGVNFTIAWNGEFVNLDGTSASTPTAASFFAIVNDALIAKGRPVLGFLNPWLYKTGYQGFVDVTSGSAIGCNTTGFPATSGWDAASGFGTPRFEKVLQTLNMPAPDD